MTSSCAARSSGSDASPNTSCRPKATTASMFASSLNGSSIVAVVRPVDRQCDRSPGLRRCLDDDDELLITVDRKSALDTHAIEFLGMQVRWAQPIVGEAIPADARGLTRSGDLVAHFTDVSAGEVSACVMGLNIDLADPVASPC